MGAIAGDALADRKAFHAIAQAHDFAAEFAAGREGQGRFDLIFVFDDQRVEKIQRHARGFDQNFARTRNGIGQFAQDQAFRRTILLTKRCDH